MSVRSLTRIRCLSSCQASVISSFSLVYGVIPSAVELILEISSDEEATLQDLNNFDCQHLIARAIVVDNINNAFLHCYLDFDVL